jgi:hypothetical protein
MTDVINAIKSELDRIGATRPQVPDAQVIGITDEGDGYATIGGSALSFPFIRSEFGV